MEEEEKFKARGEDLTEYEKGFITVAFILKTKSTAIVSLLSQVGVVRGYSCIKKFVRTLKLEGFFGKRWNFPAG